MDKFAEGLKSLMKNDETADDNEERLQGLVTMLEFFTRYVRRIHPDTHWKRAMKMNPNVVWFQLITPSDIAFVISMMKNGMPVWKTKTVLFGGDDLVGDTKAKPLFTSGEGQKRSFGTTTWSKEGLQYFHKVEATWQEAYSNREQMSDLVNGWEKWEPTGDLKKGKDLLSTNWTIIEINKKGKSTGRGEDDDDEGSDGYHSDKYDDRMDFELDDENLKKVTGLKKLLWEKEEKSDELDDDSAEKDVDEVAAGSKGGNMVSEETNEEVKTRKSARGTR